MMFWRSSPKTSPKDPARKEAANKSRKVHQFHSNPAKSWSYYDNRTELYDLIDVKKHDTSSLTDSSEWTSSIEQLLREDTISEDDQEINDFFLCPEGVTRLPFTTWEIDLHATSRLSSYFQKNVRSFFNKRSSGNELLRDKKKQYSSPRNHATSSTTSTPNNSPRA
jgi:hypothetical protein